MMRPDLPENAAREEASAGYRAAPDAPPHPLLAALPPAPRKASPAARRLLFSLAAGERLRLLVGLPLLVLGGAYAAPECADLPADLALSLAGRAGRGELVALGETRSATKNPMTTTTVRFRSTEGGSAFMTESSTTSRRFTSLPEGAPLDLEYLPLAPSVARVVGTTRSLHGTSSAVLLIFPLIGALLLLGAFRARRRRVRLFARGTATVGEVTFRGLDSSIRLGSKQPYGMRWRFSVSGKVYPGSLASFDDGAFAEVPLGAEAVVLFDPADPRQNTLWIDGAGNA